MSQVNPWAPLDATVPSVSRPTSAQTVKPIMSSRDSDLTSLLFSASASSVVSSTNSPRGGAWSIRSLLIPQCPGARQPTPAIGALHPPERRDLAREDGRSVETEGRTRSQRGLEALEGALDGGRIAVVDAALQRRERRGAHADVQLAQLGHARPEVAARRPGLELGQRNGERGVELQRGLAPASGVDILARAQRELLAGEDGVAAPEARAEALLRAQRRVTAG